MDNLRIPEKISVFIVGFVMGIVSMGACVIWSSLPQTMEWEATKGHAVVGAQAFVAGVLIGAAVTVSALGWWAVKRRRGQTRRL